MMEWTQLSITETWIILLICFLVWLSYSVHIIVNKKIKEGLLRSFLFAMGLLFLCLLIFKPKTQVKKIKGTALLLTEDIAVAPDTLPVFAIPSVSVNQQVIQVPDLPYIERNHPEIKSLYVVGHNLPSNQLKQIHNLNVHSLNKNLEGFTWLSYNRHLVEGDKLKLSGTYKNTSADSIKIKLLSAAGILDSAFIPPHKNLTFSMEGPVEFPGNYVGNIEIRKKDNIVREPLPYTIKPSKPINILILQAFPSFEINTLKEWLAEKQHQIQVNVQISRNNYSTQHINMAGRSDKNLFSEENLNEVDVLIADAERIRGFTNNQKRNIKKAVRKGMGVLAFADERMIKNPELLDENFQLNSSTAEFILRDETNKKILKLKKLPASIKESIEVVPIISNEEKDVSTAFIPGGRGKIAIQLISETFPLVLQGEKTLYNAFWSDIISSISRNESKLEIKIDKPFIWQNEMVQLYVYDTTIKKMKLTHTEGALQNLFPLIDLFNPFEASFSFLPTQQGWYKIAIIPGPEVFEYVIPGEAWKGLKQAYWQRELQQYAFQKSALEKEEYTTFKEIPIFWWYIGFVFSLGMLWWREKIG